MNLVDSNTVKVVQDNDNISLEANIVQQGTAPANPVAKDLWIDTTNNALMLYNGANWIPIGIIDDLSGNETNVAPSIRAVNAAIDNITVYSTSERIVGKDTDGKPIYEKTIIYTSALTSGFNAIPHGVVNKGTNIAAWGHINNSPYLLGAIENTNAFISVNYIDATSVGIVVGSQWGNAFQSGCTVTIQYKKTTD